MPALTRAGGEWTGRLMRGESKIADHVKATLIESDDDLLDFRVSFAAPAGFVEVGDVLSLVEPYARLLILVLVDRPAVKVPKVDDYFNAHLLYGAPGTQFLSPNGPHFSI
jgi:hypothetical protein